MTREEQALRILAALAIEKGGEIRLHLDQLQIEAGSCIDVTVDGSIVVVKYTRIAGPDSSH